ncbi:MAG: DUF72 domain-containing protein [Deltaproteobacteria bacterium]|nr:DUF72 domain-containing protein [Deltaproteobacteria bacterium]
MSEIIVGTSGFSYPDWKINFYPEGLGQESFLRYYSRHFKAVELNFTYYRMPDETQSKKMIEKSGSALEFVIKANRQMTHEIQEDSLTKVTPLFLDGISPFIEAGQLGAILLQFPQSFHYTPENRIYLKSLIDRLRPLRVSVEFRQREWLKDSVYQSLNDLGAGFVCVDEPDLASLVPAVIKTTSDLGYIRFHGRNGEKWYSGDSRTRYDYLYSEKELLEWIPKIRRIAEKTHKLYAFFNNHAKAQAVTNAKMLINLLG